MVGAVIDEGFAFITSPNRRAIWAPPLGTAKRELYLRSNLRFGVDDFIQWPQPFLEEAPHLVAIPYRPRSADDPLNIMWTFPETDHFQQTGAIPGVGKLYGSDFVLLRNPCLKLLDRAKKPVFEGTTPVIPQLARCLHHYLHRLEYLTTDLRTLQITIRETQRLFLELTACLDYMEIYKPRMEGLIKAPETAPVAETLGAITHDPMVCHQLWIAKIPVWLVRPYTDLHGTRINAVAAVRRPEDIIPLDPAERPSHRALRYDATCDSGKYRAICQFRLHNLQYPNPFQSYFTKAEAFGGSSAPPPLEDEDPSASIRKRYSPCMFFHLGFASR